MLIKCDSCKEEFYRKPSQVYLADKHYCSAVCHDEGKKNGKKVPCFVCGKSAYKSLRDLKRSKSKNNFCSTTCSNKWIGTQISQEKHPNWKGGEYSYREALKRHTAMKQCILCKTVDKRVLAVHHIDRNRKNNRLKNLMWLCHNCHFLVHHYPQEREKISKK